MVPPSIHIGPAGIMAHGPKWRLR
ncbi:uncharacterized protein METZ01_LOCUS297656 [marine metagenome]|uniref:Uncharacterized protein n=1 Tax=marine metagenome TaxID=408172 RepID=A0A382MBI8_9ZZZZ